MVLLVYRLAKASAILGGLILCVLTVMMAVSIVGRAFSGAGLGPVPGDFELVEAGSAAAVFFFLPWCHLRGGHATVDLLYTYLPGWAQRAVLLFSEVLMLLVWLVLTWRLWDGMVEKKQYMETTFILQFPLWWSYAFCLVGAVIGCMAYLAHTAVRLGLAQHPAGWEPVSTGALK